jgi:LPS-assembly lipoprotein
MPLQRRSWLALAAAGVLGGCGFQLRRPPEMPFRRIALGGFAPRSPLAEDFRNALASTAQVVETASQAEVVLIALLDTREKSVVASTSAVQVREVQLRLRFNFSARTPAGRVLVPATELLLARDMSYNETQALAKAQEETQLYRDMQSDVVTQVLRRLSALKLP